MYKKNVSIQDENTDFTKLRMQDIDITLLARYAFNEISNPKLKEKLTARIFSERNLTELVDEIESACEHFNISSPEEFIRFTHTEYLPRIYK